MLHFTFPIRVKKDGCAIKDRAKGCTDLTISFTHDQLQRCKEAVSLMECKVQMQVDAMIIEKSKKLTQARSDYQTSFWQKA